MASSLSGSGTSAGPTLLANSGSEGDLQHAMDQRKRKRMLSNRESARRSRMRKQKHLDDLTAQAALLQKENNHILANLKVMTQQAMAVEAENSVLTAQIAELSTRLQSLDDILQYMNGNNDGFSCEGASLAIDGFFMNPWNLCSVNNQAIMASPDVFRY